MGLVWDSCPCIIPWYHETLPHEPVTVFNLLSRETRYFTRSDLLLWAACTRKKINGPTHSPTTHTTVASNTSFITTQCTYWVLIQPDQRALITRIREWWLQWVLHIQIRLCARLQVLMGVYENLCVWVCVWRVTCIAHGTWMCTWCSCSWGTGTVLVTVTPLFSRGWWTLEGQPPIILFTLMGEAGPPLHAPLSSTPLFLPLSLMLSQSLTVYL